MTDKELFPQPVKPMIFGGIFGTTEAVPFQNLIYATCSSQEEQNCKAHFLLKEQ